MKTLRRAPLALLAVLVAVVALAGTACSAVDPVALQVGSWQLSSSDFEQQLDDFSEAYAAATSQSQADQALRDGESGGVWSTTFTSQLLSDQLALQLARIAVERRGLEITDDDRAAARQTLEERFVGQSGESVFDRLSDSYQQLLVDGVAAQLKLQDELVGAGTSEEALRQLFDSGVAGSEEQACASHILVVAGDPDGTTTPSDEDYAAALDEIEQLEAQIEGGADFATVAAASSDDTGSGAQGGDLGCTPRGSYVEGFEDAVWSQPIGEVGPPVKSIYGYHLVLVRSRGVPTFEDVRDDLARSVQQNPEALLQAELVAVARDVDVAVDGRFGSYDAATASVVPPAGPEPEGGTAPVDQLLGDR